MRVRISPAPWVTIVDQTSAANLYWVVTGWRVSRVFRLRGLLAKVPITFSCTIFSKYSACHTLLCWFVAIFAAQLSPAAAEPIADPASEVVVEPALEPLPTAIPKRLTLILDRTHPDLGLSLDWANAITRLVPAEARVDVVAVTADGASAAPIQRKTTSAVTPNEALKFNFTDVGSALIQLSQQSNINEATQHHFIVLNGGFNQSTESLKNFHIAAIEAHLSKVNAVVHSISMGSPPGREQFAALSAATDGWYEETFTPNGMTRAAVRLITGLFAPNQTPIADSLFRVSAGTSALTLVLFQQDPMLPAVLTSPKFSTFSQYNAPENVTWLTFQEGAVVQIQKPDPGTWHLETPDDGDNLAVVDHALRIVTTDLPRNVLQSRPVQVEIMLASGELRLVPKDSLEPVQLRVRVYSRGREHRTWYPRDNGTYPDRVADDGITVFDLTNGLTPGIHRLIIDAETSEWQRQVSLLIHAQEFPIALHHEQSDQSALANMLGALTVTPRTGLVNPSTMVMDAVVQVAGGETQSMPLNQSSPLIWQLDLDAIAALQPDTAELSIAASNALGDSVSAWVNLMPIIKTAQHPDHHDPLDGPPAPFGMEQLVIETATEHALNQQNAQQRAWFTLTWQVAAFNSAAFVGFTLGFLYWRRLQRRWLDEIRSVLAYD